MTYGENVFFFRLLNKGNWMYFKALLWHISYFAEGIAKLYIELILFSVMPRMSFFSQKSPCKASQCHKTNLFRVWVQEMQKIFVPSLISNLISLIRPYPQICHTQNFFRWVLWSLNSPNSNFWTEHLLYK